MRGPLLKKELAGVAVIFAFGGALFLVSLEIPGMPGQLGPAFWPRLVLALLLLSCVIKAVEILRDGKSKADAIGQSQDRGDILVKRLLLVVGSMVMCVYLMDKIGFPLAILMFMFTFLSASGMKLTLSTFLVSIVGTVSLTYLFVKLVYLPFPKGQWIFEEVTIIIYRSLLII